MPTIVLECPCGKRVRAPGATPGRVGRCPACGGELRVPEPRPDWIVADPIDPDPPEPSRPRRARRREPDPRSAAYGLAGAPAGVERHLLQSLAYPLWDFSGLMLPVLLAPPLMIVAMFLAFVAGLLMTGRWYYVTPLVLFLPFCAALFAYVGHVLIGFLLSATRGEVLHPRWSEPSLGALWKAFARWGVAGLVGLVVAGAPLMVWVGPGTNLLGPAGLGALALIGLGLAVGAWALVSIVVHDSVWGASPVVLIGSFLTVLFSTIGPLVATCLLAAAGLIALALAIRTTDGLGALFSLWLLSMYALYASLAVMRMWGLCYYRNRLRLGWFPERERWGVRA